MIIGKYIFDFIKENKPWVFKNVVTISLNSPLEILGISYFTSNILKGLNNKSDDYIIKNIIYLIITYIVIDLAFSYADKLNNDKVPKLEGWIRNKLIGLQFEKNKKNFEEVKSGEFIQNLIKVSNTSGQLFSHLNYNIIPFILLTIIVTIRLYMISGKIASVFFTFMVLYVVFFVIMIKNNSKASYTRSAKSSEYYNSIDDVLLNSKTVITTGNLQNELNNLDKNNSDFNKIQTNEYNLLTKLKLGITVINIVLFSTVMYIIFNAKKNNTLGLDSIISLITIFVLLFGRLKYLSRRLCETVVLNGSLKEASEIITNLKTDTINNGKKTNFIKDGNITIDNLYFSYDNKTNLLNNISFKAQKGLPLLITGQSGVGKSTLIQILLGLKNYTMNQTVDQTKKTESSTQAVSTQASNLYPTNKGSIKYDSVELKDIDIDYLRENISYLPQNPQLFNRTPLENIGYTSQLPKKELLKVIKAEPLYDIIKSVNIHKKIGSLGSKLSGGQKQVIVLFRELLSNKPIIFMDEPTSSIDKTYLVHAINLIKRMALQKTVIIITHQAEIKQHFTNIIEL
jgi:ABC-type bacteriocin/lantibiotic exporter with double-glycine peptidase domain